VPEDGIQIDVFKTTGPNISKSHFYTKAVSPDQDYLAKP
jgi:hypothetical protein